MKVTILKPITHAGKVWNVGDTPSITPELAARLKANGFIAGDETPDDEPAPETKAEEEVVAPRPRPTRKPRKPKN